MLSQQDKEDILKDFPNIKLSYENIIHKKVYKPDFDFIIGIPEGKKCFAWFTIFREKPTCFILELDNTIKKQIKNIKIVNSCFSSSLSYGTIFYGTLFYHLKNSFFTIEDINMYKGSFFNQNNFNVKLNKICQILKNEIKQISYNNTFVVFGLPIISNTDENFSKCLSSISYNLSYIEYKKIYNKNNSSNLLSIEKYNKKIVDIDEKVNINHEKINKQVFKNEKYNKIYIVKPDIQNDIYNLYSLENNEYIGLACIPDYKTSIMMNKLFRNIKENIDLDALEESDDEDEFENPNIDKFVYLDKQYKMLCNFNSKFKKWVPVKIIE